MKASNNNNELKNFIQIISPWLAFSSSIHRPQTEAEYDKLVSFLDHLLDLPPTWKTSQIEQLIHYIGSLIEEYDNQHHTPQLKTTGLSVLRFLMEQHNLKQSDLPEIGAQSIVSEILNEKRKLNIQQIKALSKRFGVDPGVFIDDE